MSVPLYPIVAYPANILRHTADPVVHFDAALKRIVKRMIPTMREAIGIGLAANQVGLPIALAVIEYKPVKNDRLSQPVPVHAIVNPKIVSMSDETDQLEEGCLSCPGIELPIRRSTSIVVEFQTIDGERVTKTVIGFPARIYQHEIDHLNGTTILDRAEGHTALLEAYRANPAKFLNRKQADPHGNH